jgi:hypothetical protein
MNRDGSRAHVVVTDLALLAIMILTSRLALVVHEVGGHAVPAKLLGSRRLEIRLSPLGGGFVSPDFPIRPSPLGLGVFDLGGIALNLLTGAAAWLGARRLKRRGLSYVALLFLGVGSIAGALVYLCSGLYYGSGDPVGLSPATEDIGHLQRAWILFLPAAAAVAWFGVRHYLDFVTAHVRTDTAARRIGAFLVTAGLVALGYGGLWLLLRDPRIEGSTRKWRLEQEIAKETERRQLAENAVPPLSAPAPSAPPVLGPIPIVRPEEVAHRLPSPAGPILLYAVFGIAGLGSLWRAAPAPSSGTIPPRVALGLAGLAAAVVAAFALWG